MTLRLTKSLRVRWTPRMSKAAQRLAEGFTTQEVADEIGISRQALFNWRRKPEFAEEVDRLSLMLGIASAAERLRIVNRVVRQKVRDEQVDTEKDLLEWLKFAQTETDESAEHIAAAFREVAASLADKREEIADSNAVAAA